METRRRAGRQPAPSERHRCAQRGGCLLTSPTAATVMQPKLAAITDDSQVWPATSPTGLSDTTSWPCCLCRWEYWHRLCGLCRALDPGGLRRSLAQRSSRRLANLTPSHRRTTVATGHPHPLRRNPGQVSVRAEIRASAPSRSSVSFRNRSCIFLPLETLSDLYIASLLSL